MSQSGSQAAAFFREIVSNDVVWFVRDDRGSPTPTTSSGATAMPYWSSRTRAQRAADIWGNGLYPASISLETWQHADLPELADQGYQVGINWTGPRLVGWDFTVVEVLNRLAHALHESPRSDAAASKTV
ncbi:DUF2750 domain-containing protein [Paractinoplanes brasiliensis]|uniref:Uncharacterized protein DUF2750 n=1 Tax=Paractinoplanes brasiliensis TaxID=52695 RepID=A0A4R6JAX6_9ACTN|nr:DUF2750 domain-containing protein [Actinoplanes brasiliensis]TDO32883.1 uncharacterized protein DUF2750 [Actinoplanes brasiliensis]